MRKSRNGRVIKTAAQTYEHHVRRQDGCWEWGGYHNDAGYGIARWGGRAGEVMLAHRLAWTLFKGPIPADLDVLHRCDNPGCVNPDDLFLGTNLDNIHDRMDKKRKGGGALGEENQAAKLTVAQVLDIRRRFSPGQGPALAREFGVGHALIYAVVKRRIWRHV